VESPERDPEEDDGRVWLGVEGRRTRFLELNLMALTEDAPRIFDADELFAELRMVKDAAELVAMRQAVAIAEAALKAALPIIQPGKTTERELAAELVLQLLRGGSETPFPFEPIVATGVSGASPHYSPSSVVIQPGDLLIVDWGAATGKYFSDITRTYAIAGADPHPDMLAAYQAVLAANAAGRAAVRPGVTGADVDAAARKAIVDAGLGEFFIHRTGHGLGLETHEEPDMKVGSHTVLEPGMTFTVEPGVYLPGLGGVRIEDDMLVTAKGGESLTTLPRELETVGG
jgi:Xaa-Pro dipeptidase